MPVRLAAALPICLILPLVAAPLPAAAQDAYPSRPIRLVVGFAAGGPTDIPARFIADRLGDQLGQRVVVENKTGAAGMLATRDVLAQPRDGYNLLLCTHFESINTAIYRNPQFTLADLAPISLTSKYFYGLTIPNTRAGGRLGRLRHIRQAPIPASCPSPTSARARRRNLSRASSNG